MKSKQERGLRELYDDDPERADAIVFGRKTEDGRRGFLKSAGLGAMAAAVGGAIPFARNLPGGIIPAAMAQEMAMIDGKGPITILGDRPLNAETPAHLLDDAVTPNNLHFVRNNGLVPDMATNMDANAWSLTIDGEVSNPMTLALGDLKSRFETVTAQLQVECGGNGRASFNPPAGGNQWTIGAIGCAEYTGVRMRDVLNAAGLKDSAIYTGYYGNDVHLSGDTTKDVISRGAPIWKMMDPNTILAFEMNGEPLPALHGYPVRIVCPGWPGSTSGKWVRRIWVRDQVHDGAKMTGTSYRTPVYGVEPGAEIPDEDWAIIQSMPVKSIISFPEDGASLPVGERTVEVRGHAWAGDNDVKSLEISIDFGATWTAAELDPPANPYAWQNWRTHVRFPTKGYYEVWARATDETGVGQPFGIKWNAKGYLNNEMHRVAVHVAA